MAVNFVRGVSPISNRKWGRTEVNVEKFSYTWVIRNFSFCREEMNDVLLSPKFSAGDNDRLKWRLCFDLSDKTTEYLSLHLQLVTWHRRQVKAKFQCSILNSVLEKVNVTYSQICIFEQAKVWGFKQFMSYSNFFHNMEDYAINDTLTIVCELSIVKGTVNNVTRDLKAPDYKLFDDFGRLFENPLFADVVVSGKDNAFKAHRSILSARSPVFAEMLKKRTVTRIQIDCTDNNVIKEMLMFIYTGRTLRLDETACGLLAVADKFRLDRLKAMCEQEICTNLTNENVSKILILADLHNANQLRDRAVHFISSHANDVIETAGFQTMVQTHPYLIAEAFRTLAYQQSGQPHKRAKRS